MTNAVFVVEMAQAVRAVMVSIIRAVLHQRSTLAATAAAPATDVAVVMESKITIKPQIYAVYAAVKMHA